MNGRLSLLIDADDTLWENNIYFERAIAGFLSFLNHPEFDLRWVCDAKTDRARAIVGSRSGIRIAASIDEVLRDDEVVAVARLEDVTYE